MLKLKRYEKANVNSGREYFTRVVYKDEKDFYAKHNGKMTLLKNRAVSDGTKYYILTTFNLFDWEYEIVK